MSHSDNRNHRLGKSGFGVYPISRHIHFAPAWSSWQAPHSGMSPSWNLQSGKWIIHWTWSQFNGTRTGKNMEHLKNEIFKLNTKIEFVNICQRNIWVFSFQCFNCDALDFTLEVFVNPGVLMCSFLSIGEVSWMLKTDTSHISQEQWSSKKTASTQAYSIQP